MAVCCTCFTKERAPRFEWNCFRPRTGLLGYMLPASLLCGVFHHRALTLRAQAAPHRHLASAHGENFRALTEHDLNRGKVLWFEFQCEAFNPKNSLNRVANE